MQVRGYDEWSQAEQREQREHKAKTDYEKRDVPKHLEKIHHTDRKVKDCKKKERNVKTKESKSWMELALDDPLFKATFKPAVFTRLGDTFVYVVDLQEQKPCPLGDRNLVFEIVHPLYKGLNAILESKGTFVEQNTAIRIQTSSRQHAGVSYTCYCTPDTWSIPSWMKSWKA